jgi:hypothetical protein
MRNELDFQVAIHFYAREFDEGSALVASFALRDIEPFRNGFSLELDIESCFLRLSVRQFSEVQAHNIRCWFIVLASQRYHASFDALGGGSKKPESLSLGNGRWLAALVDVSAALEEIHLHV